MLYFLFLNPLVSLWAAFFIFPIMYVLIIGSIYMGCDAIFGPSISLAVGIYSILFFLGLWCYEVWEHADNSAYLIFRVIARVAVIFVFSTFIQLAQGIFDMLESGQITPLDFGPIEQEAIKLFQNTPTAH